VCGVILCVECVWAYCCLLCSGKLNKQNCKLSVYINVELNMKTVVSEVKGILKLGDETSKSAGK
jgi:hypothetical protein